MMSSYQQQLEPAMQMQRAPPSQTMDSYQPQIYHQSQSQAQSVADAPSSYQTPSANDFDFLDGMNFLTESLPVPPTSESRQYGKSIFRAIKCANVMC
ncbi:hypothetical protein AB6A40_009430 [Gnathostoma spinigerum]|uniref:Uncharacterized protein n=1 Tax=Gnathostoma spinigerum TaxID=75299 RepID=A0ABD6EZ19_9BILA